MREVNVPQIKKTVAITYVLFELTTTGELKLVKSSKNNFMSEGHAEDWIAEHGEKSKNYIVQRCVQKWEE